MRAEPGSRSRPLSTLIRYALVGSLNTAITLAAMAGLARLGAHYVAFTAAGYGLGFLLSYTLNGVFTFRSGRPSGRGFGLFALVNGCLLAVVEVFQVVAVELAGLSVLAAVAAGALIYLAAGFQLNRRVVFRPA